MVFCFLFAALVFFFLAGSGLSASRSVSDGFSERSTTAGRFLEIKGVVSIETRRRLSGLGEIIPGFDGGLRAR